MFLYIEATPLSLQWILALALCMVFHPSKVVNIILHILKDAAFILSMSSADRCRYC